MTGEATRYCSELDNERLGARASSLIIVSVVTRIYWCHKRGCSETEVLQEGRGLRDNKSKWAKDRGSFRMDDDMSSPTPTSLHVDEQVSF